MLNYLLSFFRDRRKGQSFYFIDRRNPTTLKESRAMLKEATEEFHKTVTLNPQCVRRLLDKIHK